MAQSAPVTASKSSPVPDAGKAGKSPQRASVAADESVPRKRGRPKGTPKTGGRKKETPNWSNTEVRGYFIERGLFEKLGDLIEGKQIRTTGPTGKEVWARPSLELQAKTAVGILNKGWPDFQVVDQTSRDDTPKENPRQVARAIVNILGKASEGDAEPTGELAVRTAHFSDDRLRERVFPDNADASHSPEANGAGDDETLPASSPASPDEFEPGDSKELHGIFEATCIEVLRDDRRRFVLYGPRDDELGRHVGWSDVEAQANRLAAEGRYAGIVRDLDADDGGGET